MQAFKVLLKGRTIDTVYFNESMTAADVKRSLIDHDGNPESIQVIKCRGANIRTVLKNAKTVLFNDDEYFNKDVTGVQSLEDIKDLLSIRGRLVKVGEVGSRYEYRLQDSDYSFSIIVM